MISETFQRLKLNEIFAQWLLTIPWVMEGSIDLDDKAFRGQSSLRHWLFVVPDKHDVLLYAIFLTIVDDFRIRQFSHRSIDLLLEL